MPPPPISPDEIQERAPKKPRVLSIDANVVAYFGDLLHALRTTLQTSAKASPKTLRSPPVQS